MKFKVEFKFLDFHLRTVEVEANTEVGAIRKARRVTRLECSAAIVTDETGREFFFAGRKFAFSGRRD